MKLAVGSDERTAMTDALVKYLRERGHDVEIYGSLTETLTPWPDVAIDVAARVADGRVDQGILCCWTGTGVSLTANKVPGVRAALVGDAETARGARKWNDANVLCLSLRATSEEVAREIVDAWFSTGVDESERENIEKVKAMDRARS
jgi:ribose 5-phosphate isomerase B